MKTAQAKKVALGGVISALSFVAMILSSVFPMAEYTSPALAGIILIALVIEFNKKTALLAYFSVSILSLFILPNKEAVILFIGFLGYYPILKSCFEQFKSVITEWIFKIALFNIAIILAYFAIIYIFNMRELLNEFNEFSKYGEYIFLALGNIAFIIYDLALSKLIILYTNFLAPKIK